MQGTTAVLLSFWMTALWLERYSPKLIIAVGVVAALAVVSYYSHRVFERELVPHLGPWADGQAHRWDSGQLPAWIELAWPAPRRISEIHLTFDSGFHRELILSASDSTTRTGATQRSR